MPFLSRLRAWLSVAKRHELPHLSDHLARDMGLTQYQIEQLRYEPPSVRPDKPTL